MATHVSHGSIGANSVRTISILKMCCLQRTTSRSLRDAIRGQRCDSSTDLEERANFECLAAACHLPDNHGQSRKWCKRYGKTHVSACSCHWQLDVGFLTLSQTPNGPLVADETYQGIPRHGQWMLCHLEGRVFNSQRVTSTVHWLTFYDHPHILDETVNDLESLSCGSPSLISRESVQSLQDRLDILLSEMLLYKFDCVAVSKVTFQRE